MDSGYDENTMFALRTSTDDILKIRAHCIDLVIICSSLNLRLFDAGNALEQK